MVMPFYWMIVSSLHTPQNLVAYPPKWWPQPAVLTHYQNALAKAPFLLYYRNSLIVAIISVGLSLLLGLFAGYAFAIYSFPLKGFFFFLILATLMVPIQVTSVSLYILMAQARTGSTPFPASWRRTSPAPSACSSSARASRACPWTSSMPRASTARGRSASCSRSSAPW